MEGQEGIVLPESISKAVGPGELNREEGSLPTRGHSSDQWSVATSLPTGEPVARGKETGREEDARQRAGCPRAARSGVGREGAHQNAPGVQASSEGKARISARSTRAARSGGGERCRRERWGRQRENRRRRRKQEERRDLSRRGCATRAEAAVQRAPRLVHCGEEALARGTRPRSAQPRHEEEMVGTASLPPPRTRMQFPARSESRERRRPRRRRCRSDTEKERWEAGSPSRVVRHRRSRLPQSPRLTRRKRPQAPREKSREKQRPEAARPRLPGSTLPASPVGKGSVGRRELRLDCCSLLLRKEVSWRPLRKRETWRRTCAHLQILEDPIGRGASA